MLCRDKSCGRRAITHPSGILLPRLTHHCQPGFFVLFSSEPGFACYARLCVVICRYLVRNTHVFEEFLHVT